VLLLSVNVAVYKQALALIVNVDEYYKVHIDVYLNYVCDVYTDADDDVCIGEDGDDE
jgi:hypothetical protein